MGNGFEFFEFGSKQTEPATGFPEATPEPPSIPWDYCPQIDEEDRHLLCPRCGCDNLHQHTVRVGARRGEDRPGVVVEVSLADITAEEPRVTTRMGVEADYLGRRDDLSIQFWCESCHGESTLTIRQHKGLTLVEWSRKNGGRVEHPMLDDIRQSFAAGLRISLEDVVVGEDPPDPRTGDSFPDCLCVIVLRDVDPKLMGDTLRRVLPAGQFTRACVQVVEPGLADQIRGLPFHAAWDRSWDLLIATVRHG